jgi:hypothetical protein
MATQTGTRRTYDSQIGLRQNIEDVIWLISPFDVPLLGSFGPERRAVLGSEDVDSVKVEWLEDELVPGSDLLNGAAVTAAAFITVDNRGYFKTNDLLRIDNEFLRVSGYGVTASTLLVERSWGTPAATQHVDNSTVLILGTLPAEGADPVSGINFTRTTPYNITQIYQDEVEVTRTAEKAAMYGVKSEAAYQIAKRVKENAIKLERNTILGTRNDDSTNKKRSMGGLDYFIATNVDSTTTVITNAKILDILQNSYNYGGAIDYFLMGGTQKRQISALYSTYVRISRDDNVRGSVVDYFESDFGRIYMVLDRWVPTRFMFGIESQYVNFSWFDRFFTEALAKTGDRQKWEVLAEVSLKVRNEKAHCKFTALT